MHNWVEIDLSALKRNYQRIRNLVKPGVSVAPVVKAEAYGHGMIKVAKALFQLKPEWLAVSKFSEAVILRDVGITTPILVLSGLLPDEYEEALARNITPVVYTMEQLYLCETAGKKRLMPFPVHIKIDTGMGRLGFREESLSELISKLKDSLWISPIGVMSHFADADDESSSFPLTQLARFRNFLNHMQSSLNRLPPYIHIANSAGTVRYPESHYTMVRPGLVLYGPTSFAEDFEPVMSLKARILQVKKVPSGTPIGYGRSFVAPEPMVIATVSIGYGDGYPRALSNKAKVLIQGKRCPVVGRVSMNLITVDVSHLSTFPREGEEVVLLGYQGKEIISADELASKVGTISYEIYCRIGSNPVKRYIETQE
ncbi:MAG: alanine racemase [Thermodesulforhabdaceae bacterium]